MNDVGGIVGLFRRDVRKVSGIVDCGQRIAQLVGEHRQKIVLLTIGAAQLVVQPAVIDCRGGPPREFLGDVEFVGRERCASVRSAKPMTPIVRPRLSSGTTITERGASAAINSA